MMTQLFKNVSKMCGLAAVIAIVLTVAWGASAALAEAPTTKIAGRNQLRVGALLSLTGPAAVHGNNILQGLELSAKDLRRRGWEVELLVEDDGTVPARTVSAVQSLAQRKVNLFVGPTWSFLVAAAAPVLQRRNVLAMAPACSWEVGGGPNPALLFGTKIASEKRVQFKAWLQENGVKRLAILNASSDWADLHIKVLREAAAQLGVTVVAEESYNFGQEETAIPTLAAKLVAASPDAIFTIGAKEGDAKLVRMLELKRTRVKVLGLEQIRDASDLKQFSLKPPQFVTLFSLTQPTSAEFSKIFQAEYGTPPGIYADAAYDALQIYAKAVEAVGSSVDDVRTYLRSESFSYQGFVGIHNFSVNGNTAAGEYEVRPVS